MAALRRLAASAGRASLSDRPELGATRESSLPRTFVLFLSSFFKSPPLIPLSFPPLSFILSLEKPSARIILDRTIHVCAREEASLPSCFSFRFVPVPFFSPNEPFAMALLPPSQIAASPHPLWRFPLPLFVALASPGMLSLFPCLLSLLYALVLFAPLCSCLLWLFLFRLSLRPC